MRWLNNMNETIKRGIRSWLNVVPASGNYIQINEVLDFEANAIRNRIWYRGRLRAGYSAFLWTAAL